MPGIEGINCDGIVPGACGITGACITGTSRPAPVLARLSSCASSDSLSKSRSSCLSNSQSCAVGSTPIIGDLPEIKSLKKSKSGLKSCGGVCPKMVGSGVPAGA